MPTDIQDNPSSVVLSRAAIQGVRPAVDGKQFIHRGTITGATAVPYTVPADHELWLSRFDVGLLNVGTNTLQTYAGILDGTPQLIYMLWYHKCGHIYGQDYSNHGGSFWPAMRLPAGYAFQIYSQGASATLSLSLFGHLVEV